MKDIGVYVHIPFCEKKCYYCDFLSYSDKSYLVSEYIKWIKHEILSVAEVNYMDFQNGNDDLLNITSIYIGGGTPSYIDSKYIAEILNTIKDNFILDLCVEITIEINPGTVSKQKLQDYINIGINRLSIGLQTSNDIILKKIGRIHSFKDFINTFNLARQTGFKNINVDLMLGLPNQSLVDLNDSIEKVVFLKPEHISVYSLVIEENTCIEKLIKQGVLKIADEVLERKMYWLTKDKLEQNDFIHYEISNFSLPGFESKHNIDCWNQKEYIGFGVAAHSYTNGVRFSNIDSLDLYIDNFKNNRQENNFVFHEKQKELTMMKEYMILSLRKIEGVDLLDFINKFNVSANNVFEDSIFSLIEKNLIEQDNSRIKLTKKGIDFANLVWREFI